MTVKMERWAYLIAASTLIGFFFVFSSDSLFFVRFDPDLPDNPPLRAFYFTIFPLLALTALSRHFDKIEIFWPSFSAFMSLLAYMILIICMDEMKKFEALWFPGVMLIYLLTVIIVSFSAFRLSKDHELLRWAEEGMRDEARKKMRFIAIAEFISIEVPISFVTIATLV